MQRREFLTTMAAAGALSLAHVSAGEVGIDSTNMRDEKEASPEPTGRRPNILFLIPDQMRYDWMSWNKDLPIRTPNLDRITASGTRFSNAIVNSPLCAPSRACMATGMEYGKTGVFSNLENLPIGPPHMLFPSAPRPTFYAALREGGYHVMGCGKMDLAKTSDWWGLDGMWRLPFLGFSRGVNAACKGDDFSGYMLNDNRPADPYLTYMQEQGLIEIHLEDYRKRFNAKHIYTEVYPTPLPEHGYLDNWIGERGLNLLDAVPKDKPWFLQVNWGGPHSPLDITARMAEEVRGRKMPQPVDNQQYPPELLERIRQNYTAMCENIDRLIGAYLRKLVTTGQLDNTVIVFSSDHGDMLGDLGRWGKNVPYHPSASVPLIVSGPGVRKGIVSSALVNNIDLTATFLDYGGVSSLSDIDGKSLKPVLEGRSEHYREVTTSALGAWKMVYDGQYKVVCGFDPQRVNPAEWRPNQKEIRGIPPMAFDLAADPNEQRDLGNAMPAAARRLLELMPPVAAC
jgi:arylsulfatase A-like enzyme